MNDESPFPLEETPPFVYQILDPEYEITYFVYSHEELHQKQEVWKQVADFLAARRREGLKTWINLPPKVTLVRLQNGRVESRYLSLQHEPAKKRNR